MSGWHRARTLDLMGTRITFQPDLQSLAEADQLATEQGVSLEDIAAEAFAAYMQGVRDARRLDLDEGSGKE